jgi:glutamate 5-kinase
LQLSVRPAGQVTVDAGAARAVTADGASLLARGCVSVRGSFSAGDPVAVVDPAGGVVAHGLINFASSELLRILGMHSAELAHALGRRTHAEVIHRDNLVVVTGAGGRDDAGA